MLLYCIELYCFLLNALLSVVLVFGLVSMESVKTRLLYLYECLALRCFNDRFYVCVDCMKRIYVCML